jgi:branched-chain amino acid transport system ATP-binding protein
VLRLDGISAGYGGRPVLHDLRLHVAPGELVALIGANGAGKSTTLRAIVGQARPLGGVLSLDDQRLDGRPTADIVGRGVALVPEGRRVFPRLTVADNLRIGAFGSPDRRHYEQELPRIFELFPVLAERRHQEGGTLSGGEQQMLAIGRALMARPRYLLLDEPSLGLAPKMIAAVWEAIGKINQAGVAVLLVEQKAFAALKLARRGYVLENGRIVVEGPSEVLAADPQVKRAYLR